MDNKYCNIDDLKQTSKLWCVDNIKNFPTNEVYYIVSDIILDSLYYDNMVGLLESLNNNNHYYKDIYDDMKKNGWDVRYPARIGIGNKGEVYIHGGNHRINLLKDIELDTVPFQFVYLNNIKSNTPTFIKGGDNFYPNALLPKWK